MTLHDRQEHIERMLSKKQVARDIKTYISNRAGSTSTDNKLSALSEDEATAFVINMFLTDSPEPYVHMAIKIAKDATPQDDNILSEKEALIYGSNILERAYSAGFYEVKVKNPVDSTYMIIKLMSLPDEIKAKANLCMFLPPMLVKPINWISGKENGGYIVHKTSILLGVDNDHVYQPTEALNKLQSTAYTLDMKIIKHINEYEFNSPEEAMSTKFILDKIIKPDDKFYFVHRYDFRGRLYAMGWNLNPQGDDFHKAMLNFSEGEYLDKQGLKWLKRAIANAFGKDKKTWKQRDNWFSLNRNPKRLLSLKDKAEEPWYYLKLVYAYMDHLDGKKVYAPLHWDATTSMLQIYALLIRSKELGQLCNVGDTKGKRMDFYSLVHKEVETRLPRSNDITRKVIKKGLMVSFYSAGDDTQRERMEVELGRSFTELEFKVYNQAKAHLAPMALNIMEDLMVLRNPKNKTTVWNTYDGFVIEMKHYKTIKERVEVPNVGRLTIQYHRHQAIKTDRGISPNGVHGLDSALVRTMVNAHQGPIGTTHDDYSVTCNATEKLMFNYPRALADMNEMPLLEDLYSQINGKHVNVKLSRTLYQSDILKSEYALS